MGVKVVASILVFTGTLGYGYCLIKEQFESILQLEMQRKILLMMQGEIQHFHRSFPDICQMVGERCENDQYGIFLRRVSDRMNEWKGESLSQIWQMEMNMIFPEQKNRPCMQIFSQLSENMNDQQSDMQIQSIDFAREKIEERICTCKDEYRQNRRMILWLSGIAGIVCIVLFL